jgi:two-component system cell cycle response regulator PopA
VRLVLRSPEARRARSLQEACAAAGLEVHALVGPHRSHAAAGGEDVALLDAENRSPETLAQEAEAALQAGALAAVALTRFAAPPSPVQDGPVHGFIALDDPAELSVRRLAGIVRGRIAALELDLRRQTSARLGGVVSDAPTPPAPTRVLLVGPPLAWFLALDRVLTADGVETEAALSSYSAFDYLHEGAFDAVIFNARPDPSAALSLCGALRRSSDLSHMPTLLAVEAPDAAWRTEAARRGAGVIADRNTEIATAWAWLREEIRQARLRRALDDALEGVRVLQGDRRPGLFSPRFFETHIEALAAQHHQSGRPLAIAVLRAAEAPGARTLPPAAMLKGMSEISSVASRLIRPCDSAASLHDDAIAIAFPAMEEAEALAAVDRIAAVAECTAFAADGDHGPLGFTRAAASLAIGESGTALLARTLDGVSLLPVKRDAKA